MKHFNSQDSPLITNSLTLVINGKAASKVTLGGRDYLVQPVVALREIVMPYGNEFDYVSNEELKACAENWNGKPLTLDHPSNGNQLRFANKSDAIGFMADVRVEAGKLKANAYLDIELAEKQGDEGKQLISIFENGLTLDVSTGYAAQRRENSGIFQNQRYTHSQHDFIPDHLALLPNSVGRCSVKDGCGVGVYNKGDNLKDKKTLKDRLSMAWQSLFRFNSEGASQSDIYEALDKALADDLGDLYVFIIRDVFTDTVVYQLYDGDTYSYSGKLYERTYTLNEADMSIVLGEPVEVVKRTIYENIVMNEGETPEETKQPIVNTQECNCMKEKVKALIANASTQWTEDDADFLNGLTDEQLAKLEPVVVEEEKPETVTANKAEKTFDEESLLAKVGELISNKLAQHEASKIQPAKDALVAALVANKAVNLTEATLNKMDIAELESIKNAFVKTSYAGLGAGLGVINNQSDDEYEPEVIDFKSGKVAN